MFAQRAKSRLFCGRILIIVALLVCFVASVQAEEWAKVKWVDDGDTILLEDGRRIRYIGINAPEIDHAGKGREAEPFSYAARAYNKRLVYPNRIRLVFDAEKKDRYARCLAYVFLADGRFVNLKLVEEGLAYYLPRHPNQTHDALFLSAQRSAMTARRGIWGILNRTESTRYWGNRHSRRFHRIACPFAQKISPEHRVVFSSRWEAFWAGYAPAKGCLGQASEGGR